MNKNTLTSAVKSCKDTTKNVLQTVFDALNGGQQKKLLNDENVKKLFDLYEVNYNG